MQIKRYKSILITLFVTFFVTNSLLSQFNTYSPYTRFGLGDLAKPGFGQNMAMGGTGIAIHENTRINYLNPAAFAALDSTSVYFDFGANTFHNEYKTESIYQYLVEHEPASCCICLIHGKIFGNLCRNCTLQQHRIQHQTGV